MRKNLQETKVTTSVYLPKSIREEMKNFAHYARMTESKMIEEAILAYMKSDKGYAKIKAEEEAKREFFEAIELNEMRRTNLVPNSELL